MLIINQSKTALMDVDGKGGYAVIFQNGDSYFLNNNSGYDINTMTESGKKSYIKNFINNHLGLISSGDYYCPQQIFEKMYENKEYLEIIENYINKYKEIKKKYRLHSFGSVSCLEFDIDIKKLYFRGNSYYDAYDRNDKRDGGYAIYLNILDNLYSGFETVALPKYEGLNNIFLEMHNEYVAFMGLMMTIRRWEI